MTSDNEEKNVEEVYRWSIENHNGDQGKDKGKCFCNIKAVFFLQKLLMIKYVNCVTLEGAIMFCDGAHVVIIISTKIRLNTNYNRTRRYSLA